MYMYMYGDTVQRGLLLVHHMYMYSNKPHVQYIHVQYIQVYYMYNTYTTCAEDCCYCICPFQSGSTDSGNVDSSTSSKLILSHQSTQTVCNR